MKPGDKAVMVNCAEARSNKGRVWTVKSEPWALGDGTKVVKLEGKSGGFAVNCLYVVEEAFR